MGGSPSKESCQSSKMSQFQKLIVDWNRPEGLIRKGRRKIISSGSGSNSSSISGRRSSKGSLNNCFYVKLSV
jgi:hypothetical protein